MKSLTDSLLKAIRNDPELGPKFKEAESIDDEAKRCAQFVDLDIAFSPILIHGTTTSEAIEVAYRGDDGRAVTKEPYQVITLEEHKLARARFLVVRGREQQPLIDRLRKKLE